jgi:alkylation response protein AidB-like acyl-CoA dehydrogenase
MDFSLSADQTMIRDSVDRFVADAYSFDARTRLADSEEGFSREHWRTFAGLGWLGIAFPEDRGGFGGTAVETMILMEAFGKGLVLEPFVPTVVLGGSALAFGGTSNAHRELLERLIEGELLLSLAYAESGSRYDPSIVETRARREGSDLVIDGAKIGVPFGAAADKLVVSVRTKGERHDAHGITLVLVDRDAPGALAAEAVGLMTVMQRTTLAYLKTREQFGVPIGSFQALQHRAVDMLIQLELARSICYYGTVALLEDGDARARSKALSATKVQIARSGRYVGQQAIQLHGGIGMSEEYAVGHYFKRMSMLELALGDVDYHLHRFVALGRQSAEKPQATETKKLVTAGVA